MDALACKCCIEFGDIGASITRIYVCFGGFSIPYGGLSNSATVSKEPLEIVLATMEAPYK